MSENKPGSADCDARVFADKLYEWLADFGVTEPHEKARMVAASFVRDGWSRDTTPASPTGIEQSIAELKDYGPEGCL